MPSTISLNIFVCSFFKGTHAVFANKQDLPNAMTIENIAKILELEKIKNRKWKILPTSSGDMAKVMKGIDWMNTN